ncbi:hypothetical protein [Streptacidiphilus cavernicola]|uniref:Uncharacterized protein n=1 Tax=Streptacidiphilus cavernicola TaxID=3342716 RepID=A0ABV6VYF4_9ACTN
MPEPTTAPAGRLVHVAHLRSMRAVLYRVPFTDRDLAQQLADAWSAEHDGDSTVEDWARADWAATGPGGVAAIRTALPDSVVVYSATIVIDPDGTRRVHRDSATAWDFQKDAWTTRDAEWRSERRPGLHKRVEGQARGTDKDDVETAFELATAEAVDRYANPARYGDDQG